MFTLCCCYYIFTYKGKRFLKMHVCIRHARDAVCETFKVDSAVGGCDVEWMDQRKSENIYLIKRLF